MIKKMYIDSNIFIYATLDTEQLGKQCRTVIKAINQQKITCASSYLVIDEVLWILKKQIGRADALTIIKSILSLPIKWIDVNNTVIINLISLFEQTTLDPRDTLHLASMKELALSTIITEDSDFDNIKGIKRISADQLVTQHLKE